MVEKESILTDKMGKKIGNDLVTAIDDPAADEFAGASATLRMTRASPGKRLR